MTRRSPTPETCPVCGADVPPGAKACPECGADERSGWDEDKTRYDGLDLPDSAFEDEDPPRHATGQTPSIFWWVVAVGLLLVIIVLSIGF